MTTVNANIAAPRMLQVGGGAVRQIAEVLAKFGLSRPLVVTDPFMVSSGHVQHCLDPLAAAGIAVTVFSDTVPDPTDTVIEAGVGQLSAAALRLPDRLRRRLADRHRQGDGDPRRRRRQDARLQGAGRGRPWRAAGDRDSDHRRHRAASARASPSSPTPNATRRC